MFRGLLGAKILIVMVIVIVIVIIIVIVIVTILIIIVIVMVLIIVIIIIMQGSWDDNPGNYTWCSQSTSHEAAALVDQDFVTRT